MERGISNEFNRVWIKLRNETDQSRKDEIMRRMVSCLILIGLMALSSFSPAFAVGKPLFFGPVPFESTGVIADCGTFQVLVSTQGRFSATIFLDAEGNWDRVKFDYHGTDTYTNSVTGKSFSDTFHNNNFETLEPHTLTTVGVAFRLTVPGGGAVFLDIGRVAFQFEPPFDILFEAGPHQWNTGANDVASLCAAMA